jgi:ribosome assembly protein YihI (activator of Der GTPase)
LLSQLIKDPQFVSKIPVRLVVFEEVNTETAYKKAWAEVKKTNEYTK